MTFEPENQIEHFLSRLELKLKLPIHRKQEIIDELRSNLLSQKKVQCEAGKTNHEAEQHVLDSIGDPDQLASELSITVAPTSGGAVRIVRYLVAAGLIAWALMVMWSVRAWSYGFSPLTTGGILALHLSPILLIWPGIIWRSNWLFGLIPIAIGVAIVMALNVGGVSSSQNLNIEAPVIPETVAGNSAKPNASMIFAAFIVIAIYLILALQRRRQRWRVVAMAVVAFGLIESAFLVEEAKFRADRDRLMSVFQSGDFSNERRLRADESGEHMSVFWERKLCPGFTIAYSSKHGKTWIND